MGDESSQRPVLVYMPDRGVGDLMWHLPTIRAIARTAPEGAVMLATRPTTRGASLLAVEPAVSGVEELTYHSGALKRLREFVDFYRLCRRLRPRAVWILEKIGRPAQAAWLAGVPERHGFGLGHASQERWLSPGPRLPRSMRSAHRIDKLAAFETLHGLRVESREPALVVDPGQLALVAERFDHCPKPWVVFGPSATEARKCWALENFKETARAIAGQAGTIIWLGGPGDADRLAAAEDLPANLASSDLRMDAAAALIAQAAVFVGNDSGPMNVSAAVGTPTVGLFGSTPALTYSKWLTAIVSPTGDMAGIAPQDVADIVRGVLSGGRAPAPSPPPTGSS